MALLDSPLDPFTQSPAQTRTAAAERGWHLSSLDLAQGLMVVEANDDEALSLFGELQVE